MNNSPFLTTKQAARIANVHPDTVRRWCEWGRLPAKKLGNTWAIIKDEFESFLLWWEEERIRIHQEGIRKREEEKWEMETRGLLYSSESTMLNDRPLVSRKTVEANRQKLDEKIAMIQTRMKDEKLGHIDKGGEPIS